MTSTSPGGTVPTGPSPGGALILVVDDEPQIHRFLRPMLQAVGYDPVPATTGSEALRLAALRAPALVLLDLGLPDLDGQEVLRRLRDFSAVPIIVLSARDRAAEKIAALDAGANDYVEKPFDVGELLARIRVVLRTAAGREAAAERLRTGAVEIDFARRQVRVADQPIALSGREFALLAMLARHAGRVVTHRQLLTAVWGPAHAEDVQYLRVYVGQLRHKLGVAARLVRTEPGVGYRLLEEEGGAATGDDTGGPKG